MPSRPFMRFQRAAYRDGGVDLWWYLDTAGLPGFALEDDGAPNAELGRQDRTTPELLETYRDRHYGDVVSLLERRAEK